MDSQGLLLCAKYAASPNFFGYCGPDESKSIIEHLKEEIADKELKHHLSEFETLYPYLQLISHENGIADPYDNRVVEAYWVGNSLLNNLRNSSYLSFIKEKLFLDKKLDAGKFKNFKLKISNYKFLPHHSFHVFNIFKRTGKVNSNHTIETMDSCRINWGKIVGQPSFWQSRLSRGRSVPTESGSSFPRMTKKANNIFVETTQLAINNQQLTIKPAIKEVFIDYKGKSFINNLKLGDFISFHWGHVCDKLIDRQLKNLEFYTKKAIDYYNL